MTKNEMIKFILEETKEAYRQWRNAERNDDYDFIDIKRGRFQALRNICEEFKIDYIEEIYNIY